MNQFVRLTPALSVKNMTFSRPATVPRADPTGDLFPERFVLVGGQVLFLSTPSPLPSVELWIPGRLCEPPPGTYNAPAHIPLKARISLVASPLHSKLMFQGADARFNTPVDILQGKGLFLSCRISTYMSNEKMDLLQGTLDLLILKSLKLGPMHGYGISVLIRQTSEEAIARRPRLALSSALPAGAPGLDSVGMGSFRKQSQGQVLQVDSGGPKTVA